MATKDALDELADAVAERLEQRRVRHTLGTTSPKWTDRLAQTLHEIRLELLASDGAGVVGDQPER